jgi:ribulose-5-phosphate 4-epimerase/fuculose-1-phosphate aldolase
MSPDVATPVGVSASGTSAPPAGATAGTDPVHAVRGTLAVALRMFAERDYDEGAAGHLTARDPLDPDVVHMNPIRVPFDELRASDLSRVSISTGDVIDGAPVDRGGFRLHAAVYQARPDVNGVMHAHPVHLKAWSTLGRLLPPTTQESCIFYGKHAVHDEYLGVFGATQEGPRVAALLGTDNVAVILKHHAGVTVGQSVEAAAYRFYILDRSCRAQLLAEAAAGGAPLDLIDHEVAAALAEEFEHSHTSFEPIYRSIVRRSPDVLT